MTIGQAPVSRRKGFVEHLVSSLYCTLDVLPLTAAVDEAGPGYHLNGLNGDSMNLSQVEAESRTMKSQVGPFQPIHTCSVRLEMTSLIDLPTSIQNRRLLRC